MLTQTQRPDLQHYALDLPGAKVELCDPHVRELADATLAALAQVAAERSPS